MTIPPSTKKPAAKKAPAKAVAVETAVVQIADALTADTGDIHIAEAEMTRLSDASCAAALSGLTAYGQEFSSFMEKSAVDATAAMKALLAAKSLPEAFEISNKYSLDTLTAYAAYLKRLQEITAEASGQAFEPLADTFGTPITSWWKFAA